MARLNTERSGDIRTQMMEDIVAEHEQALLRYAGRLVNNSASARDVVQNVFIKLFRKWDGVSKPSAGMKSWLFRVTHNEAVDYVRRESRLRLLHERHGEEAAARSGGCASDVEDKHAAVLQHIKALRLREQQVLLLRLEQGLSYQEISEITGHKPSYVGKILHDAVRKLSKILSQEGVIGV